MQHNIHDVQDTIQNYSTYKKTGKCGPVSRKKARNRNQFLDGPDVGINRKVLKSATITISNEVREL